MTLIVVEISGGVGHTVYCDDPNATVVIVDWDEAPQGGDPFGKLETTPIESFDTAYIDRVMAAAEGRSYDPPEPDEEDA